MQKIEDLRAKNIITDKDIVVYLYVELNPYKTAQELSRLANRDYSRLTQSIKTLLDHTLICKSEEYPARYFKNEN